MEEEVEKTVKVERMMDGDEVEKVQAEKNRKRIMRRKWRRL